ncbi:MAG TPA: ATP-binding cassette domain-containing protein [Bacillota bacterium]
MEEPVIQVQNLTYTYPGGFTALREINFSVRRNEFVGIIGQNGAGKSTLLKNITGLLTPAVGRVVVHGFDTRRAKVADIATHVGFVLQNPDRQLFAQTVREEVAFGPKNLGLPDSDIEERVQTALAYVGLEGNREGFPPALSKGDRAKVVIASVLAMRPELIILDEPTSGQDYRGCYQIMDIARAFHQSGHTVVVVTHHMALVAEYADRVIVMGNGSILMDDTTRNVFARPDLLRQTYITPPQITQVASELNGAVGLTETVLRVPELGEAVLRRLGGKVPQN